MSNTRKQELKIKTMYFGCDVSKDTFDVAWRTTDEGPVQPGDFHAMKSRKFQRTPAGVALFVEMAAKVAGDIHITIVMESTGSYSLELSYWIWQKRPDMPIADVPPKQVRDWCKGVGVRAKTDRIDACMIACYGAERRPRVNGPSSGPYPVMRALTRCREALCEKRRIIDMQLHEAGRDNIDKTTARFLQKQYGGLRKACDKSIAKVEKEIDKLVKSRADLKSDCEILDEIPGIGTVTVTTVLAEAGDLRRFDSSRQLTGFAGVDPVTRESGTSVKSPGRTTRRGNARIRRVLANAAWATTRTKADNPFKTTFNRLLAAGKPKLVALVAVMRKMLATMRAVLISGCYDPEFDSKKSVENPGTIPEKLVSNLD